MELVVPTFMIQFILKDLLILQFQLWIVSYNLFNFFIPFVEDKIRNCYLCGECGFACSSLVELRDHLVRKTAWSNSSLVGCRISCLLDNKEWHEGLVTQYHKSGKHSVEFRAIGEKRWLSMSKMAFYIIERNMEQSIEYKENEESASCRSGVPIDHSETESWSYFEDISIEFAFAQSVLFKVYGGVVQETGHKTKGHTSLTDRDRYLFLNFSLIVSCLDREIAKTMKGSLLYGELLARGVNKVMSLFMNLKLIRHLDLTIYMQHHVQFYMILEWALEKF